jgi:uncharacterized protein (TIGR02453 family)
VKDRVYFLPSSDRIPARHVQRSHSGADSGDDGRAHARRTGDVSGQGTGDFAGFGAGAQAFLRSLARHNEKAWFDANRARYESEVRGPLVALVEEVDVRLATMAPEIVGDPRRSIFRIHRDVRFSNDKRPYKTSAAAWFYHADAGRGVGTATTAHGGAGFYVDISPTVARVGGGIWMPPRQTLNRIRAAIDEDHDSLVEILESPARRRRFGALATTAMLTRMPRGYASEHPAASLLRHQSFTLGRDLAVRDLSSARLPDVLAREFGMLLPLVRWLNSALGLREASRR